MSVQIETKAAVSVSEMATMCGLSRARFYQLMNAGAFPPPVYCVSTRRPIYVEELQETCLKVRRRNCGIDGRAILFYARRLPTAAPPITRPAKPKSVCTPKDNRLEEIVGGLAGLGLTVTADEAKAAVAHLYPDGTAEGEIGAVIRTVFVHLHRRNRGDSRSAVPEPVR